MNALEIREMIEYEQANQEVFTEQQMNEIRTFFESLTPTVEQEEVIKTVEEIEEYVLEMASVSPYFEDLFNKLRQHILQPNKAVAETTVEHIYTHFRCDVYFEVRETNGNTIFQGEKFSEKDKAIYQRKLASIAHNGKHIILYVKEIEGEK